MGLAKPCGALGHQSCSWGALGTMQPEPEIKSRPPACKTGIPDMALTSNTSHVKLCFNEPQLPYHRLQKNIYFSDQVLNLYTQRFIANKLYAYIKE